MSKDGLINVAPHPNGVAPAAALSAELVQQRQQLGKSTRLLSQNAPLFRIQNRTRNEWGFTNIGFQKRKDSKFFCSNSNGKPFYNTSNNCNSSNSSNNFSRGRVALSTKGLQLLRQLRRLHGNPKGIKQILRRVRHNKGTSSLYPSLSDKAVFSGFLCKSWGTMATNDTSGLFLEEGIYQSANQDLKFMDLASHQPFRHWLSYGKKEGRVCYRAFSVLHICHNFGGGTQRYVDSVLQLAENSKVLVAADCNKYDDEFWDGFAVVFVHSFLFMRANNYVQNWECLEKLTALKRRKPSLHVI